MDYKLVFTPHINISSAYEELPDYSNMGIVMERGKIDATNWYEIWTHDGEET